MRSKKILKRKKKESNGFFHLANCVANCRFNYCFLANKKICHYHYIIYYIIYGYPDNQRFTVFHRVSSVAHNSWRSLATWIVGLNLGMQWVWKKIRKIRSAHWTALNSLIVIHHNKIISSTYWRRTRTLSEFVLPWCRVV